MLITLPVLLLAVVGFYSLRQDRVLAQHEAEERAQVLAEDFLGKVWSELAGNAELGTFQRQNFKLKIDSSGHLVFPPPYATGTEAKPLNLSDLQSSQISLWQLAQRAEAQGSDWEAAIKSYREFLDSQPPSNFAAAAHYALGLLLMKQGQPKAATERFALVLDQYPNASGESGFPLQPLARLQLSALEPLENPAVDSKHRLSVDGLCSNLVHYPTPWSSQLLSVLSQNARSPQTRQIAQRWQEVWDEHETARELFAAVNSEWHNPAGKPGSVLSSEESQAASGNLASAVAKQSSAAVDRDPASRLAWFRMPPGWAPAPSPSPATNGPTILPAVLPSPDQQWLAIRLDDDTNHWIFCRSEFAVGVAVNELVAHARELPDYFGVGLEIAGRKLTWPAPDLRVWRRANYFGRRGGGVKKELTGEMASTVLASAGKSENGADRLRIQIYLTSPTALFTHQRARTFWFGLLIAASAFAALIGVVAACRAFRRQLRLNELKSNFVSSVSHELRAPIASVRLMAESLERGKVSEPPKQQEYFRFIVQECRRLSSLIENVLDFSRIEQGRKQYEFEPTDLARADPANREADGDLRRRARGQPPAGTSRCPTLQPQRSARSADGKALQQALVNLIDNALKHSPKGETVTVDEVRRDQCEAS